MALRARVQSGVVAQQREAARRGDRRAPGVAAAAAAPERASPAAAVADRLRTSATAAVDKLATPLAAASAALLAVPSPASALDLNSSINDPIFGEITIGQALLIAAVPIIYVEVYLNGKYEKKGGPNAPPGFIGEDYRAPKMPAPKVPTPPSATTAAAETKVSATEGEKPPEI
mmetsp:Transcript_14054/g.46166  ORF Transcript_14054/g.46166 Transcript_14054/m.46166 type:complete len:173 (+) Transcript_14054:41-559(+)|eukprot:CAMPEP_0170144656 /NCGR_PEP_ID=MMETSP0033_2-20121228/15164_1 /TAXON_ID=195969 /ORGANISM="Dolichomastix tenuilepis, Strain CCMP3274" /LENGTH=172 /DNA_ID=CAMNT_0010381175 /DNA_START=39 /DNA_END=557 /DNA_ORIENTATION=-